MYRTIICFNVLIVSIIVDPTKTVSRFRYEDTVWYPGHAAVERRKQAYFNEHPQIRSHSDRLLPDTYDPSDDEPPYIDEINA